ncbi:hypothetical protein K435DRAFT_593366, partial [Dendrothele bispora CBS 962.96]
MVFRHISKDVKEGALWLLEHDYIPEDIAYLLGVSERSIHRWRNNVELHGSVVASRILLQGRPTLMSTEAREDLIALTAESPELFLDEIQDWVVITHMTAISWPQLWQILKDCAISYKHLRRAAAERNEELCQEWCQAYQQAYTARQLLFIDETSKDDCTIYQHYGCSILGQRATIPANFV